MTNQIKRDILKVVNKVLLKLKNIKKGAKRMKMNRMFLVLMLVIFLLTGCSGNGVIPPPIEEPPVEIIEEIVERFVGTWLNVDKNTDNVTKIVIAEIDNYLSIRVWGKCHPDDCDWGKKFIKKNEVMDGVIKLTWLFSGTEVVQEIILLNDLNGRINVKYDYNYLGIESNVTDAMYKS